MTDAAERGAENDVRGTLAQDEFKVWCTYSDLTANRATEDKEGWDFFVEFKSSNAPHPFLDHAPPTAKALVQVKASADSNGEFRMTLSNARKLVTGHPGPAFIFVAHMENRELKKTWLIHCGSDFIERVLRALVEDCSKPLNDRTLTFRPSPDDEVTRTTLRGKIEAGVGDTRTYEQRKRQLIETVGYDAHKYAVKVRHGTGTQEKVLQDFVDLVLGLREITVESITINDARFGETRPLREIEKPTLSSPTSEDAPSVPLIFETETERAELQFRALVGSMFVPDLPEHLNKTRLVSPLIDIVIGGDRDEPLLETTVSVEDERPVIDALVSIKGVDAPLTATNLAERARAAKVVRLLADPTCRIVFRGAPDAEHLVLGRGGRTFDRRAMDLLKVIEDYHTILEHFGVPPDTHPVGPEALLRFGHTLHVFASMARGTALDTEFRFPKAGPPPGIDIGDQVSFVAGAGLKFPRALLFVVSDITGRVQSLDETTCHVVSRTGRPLSHRVFFAMPMLMTSLESYSEPENSSKRAGTKGCSFCHPMMTGRRPTRESQRRCHDHRVPSSASSAQGRERPSGVQVGRGSVFYSPEPPEGARRPSTSTATRGAILYTTSTRRWCWGRSRCRGRAALRCLPSASARSSAPAPRFSMPSYARIEGPEHLPAPGMQTALLRARS